MQRMQARSVPLPKASLDESESIAVRLKEANDSKNLKLLMIAENFQNLNMAFGRRVESNPQQAGANMVSLFRVFMTLFNGDKTQAEFSQQWEFVLRFFKENEKDGFGGARLYRGAPFWTLSHDDYQTFQAITNLIDAHNRWGSVKCRQYVDFVKLTKPPMTEAGRGRLLGYYS